MYKPILPEDLNLSGDVAEEHRLGQRNEVLAWFWHIEALIESREINGWKNVSH